MSFRERIHAKESKAETAVLAKLNSLKKFPMTHYVIPLKITVPDLFFPNERLCVFLDGTVVHSKPGQMNKDEEIDERLEKMGMKVLRIKYDPPLSNKKLEEIVGMILERLKE
jgi:very-short-patch-repair endonuclease